jgi:hypothetical protein
MAWAHEGKLDEAVADLSVAIRLQKDDARLHYERAYLRRLGALDDAAALAKRIEDARPKSDLPR